MVPGCRDRELDELNVSRTAETDAVSAQSFWLVAAVATRDDDASHYVNGRAKA